MKNDTEISKFLSFVLRHEPEAIGLSLDPAGWADIATLLAQADKHERRIDREALVRVVRTSDKKRFTLSEDGTRIRAAQGHSLATVDVQPQETAPLTFFAPPMGGAMGPLWPPQELSAIRAAETQAHEACH